MFKTNILIYSLLLSALFSCQAQPPHNNEDSPHSYFSSTHDSLPYPIIDNFDDIEYLFHQNNDTTYVINFWATWCEPCVEELPYFEQLAQETADAPIQLILISLDFKKDVRTKLLRFTQNRPISLPMLVLTDHRTYEWINKVDTQWRGGIPITLIYKGNERLFFDKKFTHYEELSQAVHSLSTN